MKYVKLSRFRWAKDFMRLTEGEIPKKVSTMQLDGRRK